MTTPTHPAPTPEALSLRLFIYVVLGTLGFFTAMALMFNFMKA